MKTLQALLKRHSELECEILGIARWLSAMYQNEKQGIVIGDISRKDYQTGFTIPYIILKNSVLEYEKNLKEEQKIIKDKLNKLEELADDLNKN